jgi:hypothetical protein
MDKTVLQQQEAIRRSGRTNMLDVSAVQRIAYEAGFHELVTWIEQHSHTEYVDMASQASQQFRGEDLDVDVPN